MPKLARIEPKKDSEIKDIPKIEFT